MKTTEKQPTFNFLKIIALATLFSALGMLPQPALESNSIFYQAFGPKQTFAQEADKPQHHDHSKCSHSIEPKIEKELHPAEVTQDNKAHHPEEVHEPIEDAHDNHDHQNCDHSDNKGLKKSCPAPLNQTKLEHDNHSDCNHDHTNSNGSATQEVESCSDSEISMSAEEIKRFGIVSEKITRNQLEILTQAPGEISLNQDRMAHIVPRVSGIVQEVLSTLGDFVEKGEIMAIIESRELADAKTEYLTATRRHKLASTGFQREEKLWRKKISSEQDYLTAEKDLAETRIALQSCEQKLRILGFTEAELKKLPTEPTAELTRFAVRSPFSGQVIEKKIILGEVISNAVEIFVVADLRTVWVDLDLYHKDAGKIKKGQKVLISVSSEAAPIEAVIDYVAPTTNPKTRTTQARVVLDNPTGDLRPGSFINAQIVTSRINSEVVVAREVLQDIGGRTCVFIQDEHGFEPRPVSLGKTTEKEVVIVAGLLPDEMLVTKNSFRLKAALETGVGSGCSSPGHSH